jgi:hypothetical protein
MLGHSLQLLFIGEFYGEELESCGPKNAKLDLTSSLLLEHVRILDLLIRVSAAQGNHMIMLTNHARKI